MDYESEAYGVGPSNTGSGGNRDDGGRSYSITGADGNQIEVVDYSRDYSGPRLADGTPDPYGTGQGLNLSTDRIDYGDDPNQVLRDLRTIEARKIEGIFNRMLGSMGSGQNFSNEIAQFQRQMNQSLPNTNPVSNFANRFKEATQGIDVGRGQVRVGNVPGGVGVEYTQDLYPGDIVKGIGSLFRSLMTQEDQNQ